MIARCCGACRKRIIPKRELSDQVVGKSRFGVKLMSLIADMATNCRMPHRTIHRALNGWYGLRVSLGEISQVLHKVAEGGKEAYDDLLWEIRGSPVQTRTKPVGAKMVSMVTYGAFLLRRPGICRETRADQVGW